MKKAIFVFLIFFGSIFVLFVILMFIMAYDVNTRQAQVLETEIINVDLNDVSDGVYIGQYQGFAFNRFSVRLEVTVLDNEISKIVIIDDMIFNQEEITNELINNLLAKQNLDVDIISGATVSSKVYILAVEDALKQGIN